MQRHARNLEFEEAARIRDTIQQLRRAVAAPDGSLAG
jgi:protein-arginine kinase activator protein McsA